MSDPIPGINGLSLASVMAQIDPVDMFGDMPTPPVSSARSTSVLQTDELTISAEAQMESMRIISSGNPADITALRTLVQTAEAMTGYPVPQRAALMPVLVPIVSEGPQAKARVQPGPIEVSNTTALVLKEPRAELLPFAPAQSKAQVVQKAAVDDVEKVVVVLSRTIVPRSVEDGREDLAWSRSLTRTLKIGVVLTALLLLLLYMLR